MRAATVCAAVFLSACVSACVSGPVTEPPPKPRLGDVPGSLLKADDSAKYAPLPPVVADRRELREVETKVPSPTDDRDQALYVVGPRSVTKADLGDFILRYFPERAADALTQLVDEAIIRLEAAREGLVLPEEVIESRTDAYLEDRRRQVRVKYGAEADLEQVVQQRFGRTLEAYRVDARRLAELALLRDRLVRLDQLREDGVEVRVLVFSERELAEEAGRRIRAGADMARLARRAGVRAPESPPPFSRDEVRPPALSLRLFAAAPGDVLDPEPFEGVLEERPHTWWQVFKIVRRWDGSDAPWGELSADIEAELAAGRVVRLEEYLRWRRRAAARHGARRAE